MYIFAYVNIKTIMKNISKLVVGAMLVAISCSAGNTENAVVPAETQQTQATIQHMTRVLFLQKVFNYEKSKEWQFLGKRPMVIDFYATWCGPCRVMSPIVDEAFKKYAGKVDIYKIDIDKEKQLAGELGIQSIPTFLFIPMNGQPQSAMGAISKEQFFANIDKLITK